MFEGGVVIFFFLGSIPLEVKAYLVALHHVRLFFLDFLAFHTLEDIKTQKLNPPWNGKNIKLSFNMWESSTLVLHEAPKVFTMKIIGNV